MTNIEMEARWRTIMDGPPVEAQPVPIKRSLSLKQRTERLIPSCSQTFSKAPSQYVQGVAPVFLHSGKGCVVQDVDGNEFLDWTMALCALTLGYADEDVNSAVLKRSGYHASRR